MRPPPTSLAYRDLKNTWKELWPESGQAGAGRPGQGKVVDQQEERLVADLFGQTGPEVPVVPGAARRLHACRHPPEKPHKRVEVVPTAVFAVIP